MNAPLPQRFEPAPTPRALPADTAWGIAAPAWNTFVHAASRSTDPILITGPSGTGKSVLAHTIHGWTVPRGAPFVPLNCAALTPDLAASELFGHERGAFTGAHASRPGALAEATGGTLFLDEIGDLPLAIQGMLLQALEERVYRRCGGSGLLRFNARLIAATHRDLALLARRGRFRFDLLFRLSGPKLELPSLAQRPHDIPVLARHFAATWGAETGLHAPELEPAALQLLVRHDWPGNLRELRGVIRQACAACATMTIPAGTIAAILGPRAFETVARAGLPGRRHGVFWQPVAATEAQTIAAALSRSHGRFKPAARDLGIGVNTLRRKAARLRAAGLLQLP